MIKVDDGQISFVDLNGVKQIADIIKIEDGWMHTSYIDCNGNRYCFKDIEGLGRIGRLESPTKTNG